MNNKAMMEIKIDVLLGEVLNRMDYMCECCRKSKEYHDTHFHSEDENIDIRYYERNEHHANAFINDICNILDMDITRVYSMARSIRKWEEKHEYQLCFPYEKCAEQIAAYLKNPKLGHYGIDDSLHYPSTGRKKLYMIQDEKKEEQRYECI